jgi:hypothetical protein
MHMRPATARTDHKAWLLILLLLLAAACSTSQVEVLSARHLPKKGGAFSTVDPQVKALQPNRRA